MAFRVPDDLAALNLRTGDVQAILKARKAAKTLQKRIDNLPERKKEMQEQLAELIDAEAKLIKEAKA